MEGIVLITISIIDHLKDNKLEPKFKKGEWITNEEDVWQIDEVKKENYLLIDSEGTLFAEEIAKIDSEFHHWTILDAKDGDVLFDGSNILLVKEVNHWHNVTSHLAYSQVYGIRRYLISGSDVIIPATKVQRDLLFSKMKKAGYEWEAEKKEFNKMQEIDKELLFKDLCAKLPYGV